MDYIRDHVFVVAQAGVSRQRLDPCCCSPPCCWPTATGRGSGAAIFARWEGCWACWPGAPVAARASSETCNQLRPVRAWPATGRRGAGAANWKAAECFGCLNCTLAAREAACKFTLDRALAREPPSESVDLSQRASWPRRWAAWPRCACCDPRPRPGANLYNPASSVPPGARAGTGVSPALHACGLCMKVCPTGGLQPAWTRRAWGPLDAPAGPAIGQCDFNCNLCGQVCPTEAIQPLPMEEKQKVRIGLAAFDISRCIPYAYGRDCMVCEEHCPIPDKAIYCLEVEVKDRKRRTRRWSSSRTSIRSGASAAAYARTSAR